MKGTRIKTRVRK